jgi:hypothetical protein
MAGICARREARRRRRGRAREPEPEPPTPSLPPPPPPPPRDQSGRRARREPARPVSAADQLARSAGLSGSERSRGEGTHAARASVVGARRGAAPHREKGAQKRQGARATPRAHATWQARAPTLRYRADLSQIAHRQPPAPASELRRREGGGRGHPAAAAAAAAAALSPLSLLPLSLSARCLGNRSRQARRPSAAAETAQLVPFGAVPRGSAGQGRAEREGEKEREAERAGKALLLLLFGRRLDRHARALGSGRRAKSDAIAVGRGEGSWGCFRTCSNAKGKEEEGRWAEGARQTKGDRRGAGEPAAAALAAARRCGALPRSVRVVGGNARSSLTQPTHTKTTITAAAPRSTRA